MKSHYVKDLLQLDAGQMFRSTFRLKNMQMLEKKSGGLYFSTLLCDKTGEVQAKWWNGREQHLTEAQQKPYAMVSGKVDDYNGKRQVIIQAVPMWLGDVGDSSEYEAAAALPLASLSARLDAHIASVRNPYLQSLLNGVFEDVPFRNRFDKWPGAKSMHHAYRHGLLQHTLEVTDVAGAIADKQRSWGYVPLSKSLIVAGALLHDVGKVFEIEVHGDECSMSRTGMMLGHIAIGRQVVNGKMSKISDFPPELRDAILHVIDAHHGKPEFGSPIPPQFAEAQIIHMADLLSAQMFYFQEVAQSVSEEFSKSWKLDNRQVYTRSWMYLDGPALAPGIVKEAPVTPAPQAGRAPAGLGSLPVFRFHNTTDEAGANTAFHTRRLPLVGRAAAGVPQFAEQHIESYFQVEDERLPLDEHYLLLVEGDSMTGDGIRDGGMVVVRRQEAQEADMISVVYFDDRSEAALKRVAQTDGGTLELLSSNPTFAPIPVADPASLRICGRVVGIIQNEEGSVHAH